MDWGIFQNIIQYLFTSEHIATILTIVIAIVIYELLKKSVRKGVGYVTQRKSKAGIIILFIAVIALMVYLI